MVKMMTNDTVVNIRWRVTDPQGRQVVLRQETYEKHILDDHFPQDALMREKVEDDAKRSVTNPRFILKNNHRHLYYDVVLLGGDTQPIKVKTLKTVVDIDRIPNEVVTWMTLRKGDTLKEGEKIYEQGDEIPHKKV